MDGARDEEELSQETPPGRQAPAPNQREGSLEDQQISGCASVEQVLARGCGDQQRVVGPAKGQPADRSTFHIISS